MIFNKYFIFVILIVFVSIAFSCPDEKYRDSWQKPDQIMDSLDVKPGMIIGEIGAGEGYFTFKLSKRVTPQGKIYANDINKSRLIKIKERCQQENINNITTILGAVENPLFPERLDMIIMVYVFHELEKPVELLNNIKDNLKPQTKVVVVASDPVKWPSARGHFLEQEKILRLFKKAEFNPVHIYTFLPRDNVYVFRIE